MNAPAAGVQRPSAVLRSSIPLAAAVIVLAAVVAYSNTLSAPFVFDDVPTIAENPTIRRLWPIWVPLNPPSVRGETVSGRPVLNFSLALNYAISGTEVWSYHALNLGIHLLAGLTLFGLVRRTLRLRGGQAADGSRIRENADSSQGLTTSATIVAFFVALLWTVHPLQTESVTYIVQRAESLMGLFYLLTLYGFARSVQSERPRLWQGLSVLACLLGMATKEVMVSAPVIVLLFDRTFVAGGFHEAWRQRRRFYLGLAATWLLLGWLVASTGGRGGTAGFAGGVAGWTYALTQCAAVPHYLRLSLWPHPLVFDYGERIIRSANEVGWYLPIIFGLLAGTIAALRYRPVWGFLGAWFCLILAPTSSVVPVATQTMAEHRMYLPLAAVIVVLAAGLLAMLGRRALILLLAAALGLGWMTVRRNQDYRSELVLWQDTVAKLPDSARAHCNLGLALFEAGRLAEAIAEYEAALRIKPDLVEAHNNLGNALYQTGRLPEAMAQLTEALRIEPRSARTHRNLGTILAQAGRLTEAMAEFEAALQIDPTDADAQTNLGNVLFQSGRLPEAVARYEQALRTNPDSAETHNNLGTALLQLGRPEEARRHYQEALRLRPDYAKARDNLLRLPAPPPSATGPDQ